MSFILDALKKSENERRAGNVPGFEHASSYVIASGRQPRHAGMPLLMGGGMLVIGLVLGGWRSWQPQMPARISPAMAMLREPATMLPLPEVPAVQKAADTRPAGQLKATLPPMLLATSPQRPTVKTAGTSETRAASKLPAPIKAQTQVKAQTAPVASEKPANSTVADAAIRPAPVAASSARVVDYKELPVDVRAGLPKVVFGGYAGVDEAEVHIAFINNQLVKEGEEVSPGLKLEQVGREGVVLGYKGLHFRPGS